MTGDKKRILDLIEKDKKEQRDLQERSENLERSVYISNTQIPNSTDEIQQKLDELKSRQFLNSDKAETSKVSGMNKNFTEVLSKNNFAKNMVSGSTGGLTGSAGINNMKDIKDFVQYNMKNADIIINGEKMDLKDVDFRLSEKMNNHSVLNMEFTFPTKNVDKYKGYVYTLMNTIQLELNRTKETGEEDFKAVFDGIIEKVEISQSKGEYSSGKITAYSKSILMDKIIKYRSFQNPNNTVGKVIREIGEEYPEITIHIDDSLVDKKIPHMLLQLGETDFQFINRMLNIMNYSLSCHLGSLVCGILELTVYELPIETEIYTSIREDKNLLYKVQGTNIFNVVEKVNVLDGDEEVVRVVYSSDMHVENNVVQCEVLLLDLNDKQLRYDFPLTKNTGLIGRAVEGRVVEVGAQNGVAVLTVDFTHGLARLTDRKSVAYTDSYAGTFNFPYTSMYSQSNTGFFVTPEKNDVVSIYFPAENESLGYVQGCVNNPGNARASNRDNRNFGSSPSATGQPMFNFALNREQFVVNVTDVISLTASNSVGVISSGGSVNINGNSSVDVTCQGTNVNLQSADMNITASGTLTAKGEETNIGGAGETTVTGSEVEIN